MIRRWQGPLDPRASLEVEDAIARAEQAPARDAPGWLATRMGVSAEHLAALTLSPRRTAAYDAGEARHEAQVIAGIWRHIVSLYGAAGGAR